IKRNMCFLINFVLFMDVFRHKIVIVEMFRPGPGSAPESQALARPGPGAGPLFQARARPGPGPGPGPLFQARARPGPGPGPGGVRAGPGPDVQAWKLVVEKRTSELNLLN